MKRKTNLIAQIALIVSSLALSAVPVSAQSAPDRTTTLKTNSRILYHDGPVRTGAQDVYFIFYGCWGSTVYAGTVFDGSYSHGFDLTTSDIEGIIYDQITSFSLPQDPQGIYVVIASADITSTATGFCTPLVPPFHGSNIINGGLLPYVFLGNPSRCPNIAGATVGQPSPNGSFTGDALVLNLAHALNGLLTNPYGNGWFDRYNLENADKCTWTFGQTYTTANGARANLSVGGRDFLLEQNWVNARKGYCAMAQ